MANLVNPPEQKITVGTAATRLAILELGEIPSLVCLMLVFPILDNLPQGLLTITLSDERIRYLVQTMIDIDMKDEEVVSSRLWPARGIEANM
jgi:hypothetical protein